MSDERSLKRSKASIPSILCRSSSDWLYDYFEHRTPFDSIKSKASKAWFHCLYFTARLLYAIRKNLTLDLSVNLAQILKDISPLLLLIQTVPTRSGDEKKANVLNELLSELVNCLEQYDSAIRLEALEVLSKILTERSVKNVYLLPDHLAIELIRLGMAGALSFIMTLPLSHEQYLCYKILHRHAETLPIEDYDRYTKLLKSNFDTIRLKLNVEDIEAVKLLTFLFYKFVRKDQSLYNDSGIIKFAFDISSFWLEMSLKDEMHQNCRDSIYATLELVLNSLDYVNKSMQLRLKKSMLALLNRLCEYLSKVISRTELDKDTSLDEDLLKLLLETFINILSMHKVFSTELIQSGLLKNLWNVTAFLMKTTASFSDRLIKLLSFLMALPSSTLLFEEICKSSSGNSIASFVVSAINSCVEEVRKPLSLLSSCAISSCFRSKLLSTGKIELFFDESLLTKIRNGHSNRSWLKCLVRLCQDPNIRAAFREIPACISEICKTLIESERDVRLLSIVTSIVICFRYDAVMINRFCENGTSSLLGIYIDWLASDLDTFSETAFDCFCNLMFSPSFASSAISYERFDFLTQLGSLLTMETMQGRAIKIVERCLMLRNNRDDVPNEQFFRADGFTRILNAPNMFEGGVAIPYLYQLFSKHANTWLCYFDTNIAFYKNAHHVDRFNLALAKAYFSTFPPDIQLMQFLLDYKDKRDQVLALVNYLAATQIETWKEKQTKLKSSLLVQEVLLRLQSELETNDDATIVELNLISGNYRHFIQAHRKFLVASSPVFSAMLGSNAYYDRSPSPSSGSEMSAFKEGEENYIRIEQVSIDGFLYIIRCMESLMKGNSTQGNLTDMCEALIICDRYLMMDVAVITKSAIIESFSSVSDAELILWLSWAIEKGQDVFDEELFRIGSQIVLTRIYRLEIQLNEATKSWLLQYLA